MATIRERPTKKGKIRYRADIRIKGFPTLHKSFDTRAEAETWAAHNEKILKKDGLQFPRLTLAIWIERYIVEEQKNYSAKKIVDETKYLKFWEERLGSKIATEITPDQIEIIANSLYTTENRLLNKSGYSPETRRKYIWMLHKLYKVAISLWRWAAINPAEAVNKHKELVKEHQKKYVEKVIDKANFLSFKRKFCEMATSIMNRDNIKVLGLMEKSGKSKSQIQNVLNPENNCTIQSIVQTAEALGLELIIQEKQ